MNNILRNHGLLLLHVHLITACLDFPLQGIQYTHYVFSSQYTTFWYHYYSGPEIALAVKDFHLSSIR